MILLFISLWYTLVSLPCLQVFESHDS
ncbi:hypothetical protein KP509_03G102900 [Ceratopteris richardii]|uniref:Uncharacterized protein n=1 Tax=Ceratopteris richardii TaxID=49495 RepID=A0A8T2V2U3_CERRI|nr:hypothetical protein KP509_03G102900 [Ceratopteris richardii]